LREILLISVKYRALFRKIYDLRSPAVECVPA